MKEDEKNITICSPAACLPSRQVVQSCSLAVYKSICWFKRPLGPISYKPILEKAQADAPEATVTALPYWFKRPLGPFSN